MRKLVAILTMLAAVGPVFGQAPKRRVAVLNFDYSTVYSNVAAIFNQNVDVGKGIADLLVDKLVADGQFSVIERKALDKVLQEQNFSNSDRANPSSAAKLGQILGVDAIIIGSITQFGRDDKTTEVGGLGRVTGRYGIGGVGKKESKATVGITARIINVDTGEILASASGTGSSTRSGTALLGAGGSAVAQGGGGYDMRSSNFASTLLGEAVGKSVGQVSQQLEAHADRVQARVVKVQGLVADVSAGAIIINIGSKAGVKVGDQLDLLRETGVVTDPQTGRVIRRKTEALGSLTITEVDELSAVGKFNGAGAPKVGDMVRSH